MGTEAMSNLLTILRRELSAYFNSAIAYIFLIVFLVFTNGLFMLQFFQVGKADMRGLFGTLPFILNIFISAISMRLWTEDRKGNTFELLLTFPMKSHQLVLGKFFASLIFYLFALSTTLTIPLMLYFIGKPDFGQIFSGYLGAAFFGAAFLAIGIFVSGLCKDQIVAFVLTVITTFLVFFAGTGYFASFMDGWLSGFGTFVKNYLGMAQRLDSFAKGVLDLRDVAYFVLLTFIFLFLNGLSLEGRFRPKARLVFSGAVAVSVVSLVLVNWLIHDISMGRFDLTEGQSYTISDVSLKILKNLKVPVQVKLYITPVDSMPTLLKTLEREVVDKLEELRIASDNKLKFKIIHLEATEDMEESLKKKLESDRIMPFQVESIQRDEVGVKLIYSTLIIEYKEKMSEIIPRIVPQTLRDLEYQLLSRIYKMTLEERPTIAVFAPATEEALPEDLNKLVQGAGEKPEKEYLDEFKTATLLMRNNGYRTVRVALTKEDPIPDKTNFLMLFNPGKLTDRQRYEINKYLYQGGTVLLAAQGFGYTFAREEKGIEAVPQKLDLGINKLIEKWGVKINEDILMDENSQVISLTTGQTIGPYSLQMPVKFPNQINVSEATINRSASITSRIPTVGYLWGSALDIADNVLKELRLKSTVLFTSSPQSWKMSNDGTTHLTQENTKVPSEKLQGKFPLSVLLEGQFTDTFSGTVPVWPAEGGKEGDIAPQKKMENPKPGRLLVVGCSKAFSEDLIQSPGNLNFFANVVDGLTLGEDLVKIRSKAIVIRDIKRLSNAEKIWYKFLTTLAVPIFLLIVAASKLFLRKKEKEFYIAAISAKAS